MKLKYSLLLLVCFSLLQSCTSETDKKTEWCTYMALGTFEGKTDEGITVTVMLYPKEHEDEYALYDHSFKITYKTDSNKSLSLTSSPFGIDSFGFGYSLDSIQKDKSLDFHPNGYWVSNSMDEWEENFSDDIAPFTIKFLSNTKIELKFPNAQTYINKALGLNINKSVNSIILTKVLGIANEACFDFQPLISYEKFTDHEKQFIYHDLYNWKIADKDLMLDYMLRKPEPEGNAWGVWNKSLKDVGTVFKLDLNGDNEQDLCGYFTHEFEKEKNLVFKIFMYNGFTYDEVFSEDISDYSGGDGIYYPCGTNVCIDYPDKGGGALYYNKLSGKIEEHYYD